MNYQKIYDDLINKTKSENRKKLKKDNPNYVYFENHHIIPKCMGGTNDKDNLVLLTGREHYVAHKLLTFIYHNRYMACAFHKMVYGINNKNYKLSSRDYQYARELISKTSVSKETCNKISESNKGKFKSEETKQKMRKPKSEEHKKHIKEREYTEEHKKHLSESLTGRIFTEEWKRNISLSRIGEKNWNFNKPHSEEWNKKISNSLKIKILQYDLNDNFIKEWDSAKDVEDSLKIGRNSICSVCKNRRKSAGGFKWKYKNEI